MYAGRCAYQSAQQIPTVRPLAHHEKIWSPSTRDIAQRRMHVYVQTYAMGAGKCAQQRAQQAPACLYMCMLVPCAWADVHINVRSKVLTIKPLAHIKTIGIPGMREMKKRRTWCMRRLVSCARADTHINVRNKGPTVKPWRINETIGIVERR